MPLHPAGCGKADYNGETGGRWRLDQTLTELDCQVTRGTKGLRKGRDHEFRMGPIGSMWYRLRTAKQLRRQKKKDVKFSDNYPL